MSILRPRVLWPLMLMVGVGVACNGSIPPSTPVTVAAADDPDLQGPELFEDVTAASGVSWTYRNGEEINPPHLSILESLGGGVALIDVDRDGLLDLFLPGGGYFDGPDKKTIKGHPCRLYKNLGGFKFKDITAEVGLDSLANGQPWFYTHGAAVADYDRDGWADLLVTGWGRVALFRNEPSGKDGRRFTDVSAAVGLNHGITWSTSAAFADLDRDGWPDLYVCQYVDWSFANHPIDCNYDGKTRDVCPPKRFQGLPHKLFRNQNGKQFIDISSAAGLHPGGGATSKGLGVIALDVNLDGMPEIYVANDTVANFLYINESKPGAIKFREQGALTGTAYDGHGGANGSMGVDAGDPDGSGLPWIWVTNYENELHALYRNRSTREIVRFVYLSPASGVGAIGQKFVGWGTGFVDIDHDGWEDLFIVNGHAIRYPTGATRRQKPVLLRNRNAKFKDITPRGGPYFRQEHLARGVALGDLDNDGRMDAVISHMNEPVTILRNISSEKHHWLGIELAGKDHTDLVGTRVVLEADGRKQTRFTKGGGSYASAPDRRFIFGLGTANKIDRLTIHWPDGNEQSWTALDIDRYYLIEQGKNELQERYKSN